MGELDFALIEAERERLEAIRINADGGDMRPVTIRRAIQNAAGSAMGIIRTTEALEAARDELARIRKEDLPRQAVGSPSLAYNMEWKEAVENYNLLTIAELSVLASLTREESLRQLFASRIPRPERRLGVLFGHLGLRGRLRDRES